MRNERDVAELIFDMFRENKCRANEGFVCNSLFDKIINTLNPKEQECFNIVYCGLQALGYISVDSNGMFIRLTDKGYDYIYDDEVVNRIKSLPWVIPPYGKTDWNVAYNHLWKIIGPSDNAQFYLSGPNYMKRICSLDDSICSSYGEFINDRRNKNLSTSRVDYFKELLMSLDDEKKYELFVNIQASIENGQEGLMAENQNSLTPLPFDDITNDDSIGDVARSENKQDSPQVEHPRVFISYSWDNDEHVNWVLHLAETLVKNWGIDVILDQWELHGGKPIPHFMASSVNKADRVICIITPNYYTKAEGLQGGVGSEYSIITSKISKDLQTDKFIPLLRRGNDIPTYLDGRFRYELQNDKDFDGVIENIAKDIFNIPKHVKPKLGALPNFE